MHDVLTLGDERFHPNFRWMPGANGSLADHSYCQGRVRVTGFGRLFNGTKVDWSFRPLQKFEDGQQDTSCTRNLPVVAAQLGIKEILAPSPEFGVEYTHYTRLRTRIPIERNGKKVTLLRGHKAEICKLFPGETYGLTTSGCAVVWMYHPSAKYMLAAHAGLECLLDMPLVLTGQKSREHKSIIDRMKELMQLSPEMLASLRAGYAFPIEPVHYRHEFAHPTYGDKNKRLCAYLEGNWGHRCINNWSQPDKRKLGCIDLGYLIFQQLRHVGVPEKNIHVDRAPSAVDTEGTPLWYDTRTAANKDARNLALVTFMR